MVVVSSSLAALGVAATAALCVLKRRKRRYLERYHMKRFTDDDL